MLSNNFVLVASVAGQISADQLRGALSQIYRNHPVLAATGAAAVFPLTVHTDCTDKAWVDVVDAELGAPFPDEPGPRARFHLLQRPAGFDLLAGFDHGVCEGLSGIFVFRDVLQWATGTPAPVADSPSPPMMDALIPPQVLGSPRFRLKLALGMALVRGYLWWGKRRGRRSLPSAAGAGHASSSGPAGTDRFVVVPTLLSPAQTSALAARCKAEGVSVNGAVCVAWLRALFAESEEKSARSGQVSSPVDLRQRAASSVPETSGRFITMVETTLKCRPDEDFWDVARRFKRKFDANLVPQRLFFRPAMFEKILSSLPSDDIRTLMLAIFGGAVRHDFSISNLGRLALPERIGSLELQAVYGLVNSSPLERTVTVLTLGTKMTISLIFRRSLMDVETGQRLMDRAMQLLAEAQRPT